MKGLEVLIHIHGALDSHYGWLNVIASVILANDDVICFGSAPAANPRAVEDVLVAGRSVVGILLVLGWLEIGDPEDDAMTGSDLTDAGVVSPTLDHFSSGASDHEARLCHRECWYSAVCVWS